MKRVVTLFALLSFAVSPASAENPGGQRAILFAFFGLDDSRRIQFRTAFACRGFKGSDGMPVIFSKEIDESTLDAEDFRITTASGSIGRYNLADELRTSTLARDTLPARHGSRGPKSRLRVPSRRIVMASSEAASPFVRAS